MLADLGGLSQAALGERLRAAALRGDLAAVEGQLAAGAPVDSADADGCTALAIAATRGWLEVLEKLLRRGADPNLPARSFH